jgi:hypothetical protein
LGEDLCKLKATQKFDVQRFDLRKLNDTEVKEVIHTHT